MDCRDKFEFSFLGAFIAYIYYTFYNLYMLGIRVRVNLIAELIDV